MTREILRLIEKALPRHLGATTTTLEVLVVVGTPNSDGTWISVCSKAGEDMLAGCSIRVDRDDMESLIGTLQLLVGPP